MGLVDKIEPHALSVPHGDRSNVVIEPFLTDQWYVNAAELAKPAIAAVRDGKHQVRAAELGNDLFQLDGKHPAVVHLAPALVGPSDSGVVWAKAILTEQLIQDPEIFVAHAEEEALEAASAITAHQVDRGSQSMVAGTECVRVESAHTLRDEDVLDTWFSSALWPFSTLGWPEQDQGA